MAFKSTVGPLPPWFRFLNNYRSVISFVFTSSNRVTEGRQRACRCNAIMPPLLSIATKGLTFSVGVRLALPAHNKAVLHKRGRHGYFSNCASVGSSCRVTRPQSAFSVNSFSQILTGDSTGRRNPKSPPAQSCCRYVQAKSSQRFQFICKFGHLSLVTRTGQSY